MTPPPSSTRAACGTSSSSDSATGMPELESASSWPGGPARWLRAPGRRRHEPRRTPGPRRTSTTLTFGDTIRTANLTVNLGARFDYQQGPETFPPRFPPIRSFRSSCPAVQYDGDSGYPITWRSVQPRVGATYALGEDGRTLLRASYARFADQLGFQVFSVNAFPGIAELDYPWNDANGNGCVEPRRDRSRPSPLYWGNVDPDDPGSSAPSIRSRPSLEPPRRTSSSWVSSGDLLRTSRSRSRTRTARIRASLFSPLIGTTRASYRYVGNATGTVAGSGDGFVSISASPTTA